MFEENFIAEICFDLPFQGSVFRNQRLSSTFYNIIMEKIIHKMRLFTQYQFHIKFILQLKSGSSK